MSPMMKLLPGLSAPHETHSTAEYPTFPLEPATSPTDLSRRGHVGDEPSSNGFMNMLWAYRETGGTARGDDLSRLLQSRPNGGYLSLSRLIVTRKVFSFKWRSTYWVPMFQFDLSDLSVRPGPQQVLAELSDEYDDWSLAVWFTRPHRELHGAKPVDLMNTGLEAVLGAARADRFVASP
jgi:hypothetical protein